MSDKRQKLSEEQLREFIPQIEILAARGLKNEEIADCLGISRITFFRYRSKYSFIEDAYQVGSSQAISTVVAALYKKAIGYEVQEEEITEYLDKKGEPIVKTKRNIRHFPPDVGACVFFLKNRRPDEWKDRREVTAVQTSTIPEFKDVTDDDLTDMIKTLSKELKHREKAQDETEVLTEDGQS